MTIQTIHSKNTWTGNGTTKSFDFTFSVIAQTPTMDVLINNVPQVSGFFILPNSDQSVSPGGKLQFTNAPADGAVIEAIRNTVETQLTDFPPETRLNTPSLELALDKQVMMIQEVRRDVDERTFVWRGEWDSTLNYQAGEAVSHNGGSYIAITDNINSEPPSANWASLGQKGDTGPAGPKGDTGATGATGATGPTGPAGANGTNGTNGTNGNTVLSGTGAPSGGTGVNGDYYIDTVALKIYGPKTAGAWGSGTNIQGPTGATGPAGPGTITDVVVNGVSTGLTSVIPIETPQVANYGSGVLGGNIAPYGVGSVQSLDTGIATTNTPNGVCSGSDGNLWYSTGTTKIGKLTPGATSSTEYTTTTATADVTPGPDSKLWYATGTTKIGKIATTGTGNTEYTTSHNTLKVCTGPDGNIWYATGAAFIGKVTPSGTVTEYATTSPCYTVCVGPDGNIWYGTQTTKIGRCTTAGVVTEFTTTSNCYAVKPGPDGNLWYSTNTTKIGKCGITGTSTEFTTTSALGGGYPAFGPEGRVYYHCAAVAGLYSMNLNGTDEQVIGVLGTVGSSSSYLAAINGSILLCGTARLRTGAPVMRFPSLYSYDVGLRLGSNLISFTGGPGNIAWYGPGVQVQEVGVQAAAGQVVSSDGSGTRSYVDRVPSLKASGISTAGRQLPTSGNISGEYWHLGNWTQSGTLTLTGPTRVYMNGSATFLTTAGAVTANTARPGGAKPTTTSPPQPGAGPGGNQGLATFANWTGGGAGAGGPGGTAGGKGGSTTANTGNYGGYGYDWRDSLDGSSGQGSGATTAGNGAVGGNAKFGLYFEATGDITCAATGATAVFDFSGGAGGNASGVNGGGGGGASGAAVVMRTLGNVDLGSSTKTIFVGGGAGGNPTSSAGGNGGGGAGGAIDIQAAGSIVANALTAAVSAAGGAAGSGGSAGFAGTAGADGTVNIVGSTTPVSAF
ncbi:MAG: hypothetical protein JST01_14465 [Cyanobacteria bacterium SZAS TMP-1]|nr:hypothetical protein [Cyanobacteria bacterium SZAS TMP-1]